MCFFVTFDPTLSQCFLFGVVMPKLVQNPPESIPEGHRYQPSLCPPDALNFPRQVDYVANKDFLDCVFRFGSVDHMRSQRMELNLAITREQRL